MTGLSKVGWRGAGEDLGLASVLPDQFAPLSRVVPLDVRQHLLDLAGLLGAALRAGAAEDQGRQGCK